MLFFARINLTTPLKSIEFDGRLGPPSGPNNAYDYVLCSCSCRV